MSEFQLINNKSLIPTSRIAKNETPDFCKGCGGCCKSQPGGYSPDQFSSEDEIINLLVSNKAILDWWVHGIQSIYYLRPKKATEFGYIAANSPPMGNCIHLTEKGCSMAWSKRPHNCRALRAFAPKECEPIYEISPKKLVSFAWHNSEFDLEEMLSKAYEM
tara:strand:+ start:610 stop:1092 length:483 start_codon:yes stop_codon:yes gene_type:complete